jgi:single-strand DNA-binding protein
MKNITIAGNVGKDAETRRTQSGDAVTSFSIAVEDRIPKEKGTIWFRCSLWGKRGESLAQYLTKGSKVAVSGELSIEVYEGKTNLTVKVDQVTLLGGGQDNNVSRRDPGRQTPAGYGAGGRPDLDDEIPFNMEWR